MIYIFNILNKFALRKLELVGLLALTTLWLLVVVLVNFSGDFPLNDDWSFGKTAFTYYRTGDYKPGDWPAMSLITNIVLSTPFIHIFGENFVSLRISSLFYHWLSSVFIYWASVKKYSVIVSTFIAAAVLFSPLSFILSFTFMTESLFQLLCILIVLVVINIRDKYQIPLIVLSVLATLSRQIVLPALLLPIVYNWKSKILLSQRLRHLVPFFVAVSSYVAYRWWLESTNRMPANQSSSFESMLGVLRHGKFIVIVGNIQQSTLLLGFLLFPTLLLFFAHEVIFRRVKSLVVFLFLILITIAGKGFISKTSMLFPYSNNVISPYGFGPLILSFDSRVTWSLPLPILISCTVISVLGAAMLLAISFERIKLAFAGRSSPKEYRLIYFSGMLLLPSVLIDPMYDRYVAIIVGTVVLTIVSIHRKWSPNSTNLVCTVAAITFNIGFCLVAGSDYMNINRARNRAYEFLIKEIGANPHTVDAGFEYNGMNNYRQDFVTSNGKHFWMEDVQYGVGFQTPPNCKRLYGKNIRIMLGTQHIDVVAYKALASPRKND